MDGGGCGLHGGAGGTGGPGGGGGEAQETGPQHGMITLEDLEAFSEDELSDSGTGSLEAREMMEDEEENRLLSYWQDVARGHRIEVPTGNVPTQLYSLNKLGPLLRWSLPTSLSELVLKQIIPKS